MATSPLRAVVSLTHSRSADEGQHRTVLPGRRPTKAKKRTGKCVAGSVRNMDESNLSFQGRHLDLWLFGENFSVQRLDAVLVALVEGLQVQFTIGLRH